VSRTSIRKAHPWVQGIKAADPILSSWRPARGGWGALLSRVAISVPEGSSPSSSACEVAVGAFEPGHAGPGPGLDWSQRGAALPIVVLHRDSQLVVFVETLFEDVF
jgi:hypothetical protein